MDKYVANTIYRLENTAILPFLSLRPTMAVIIHSDTKKHKSEHGYLKAILNYAQEKNVEVQIHQCGSAIEVSDTLVRLKQEPYLDGIVILSDFGDATRKLYNMIPRRLDIESVSAVSLGNLIGNKSPVAYRKSPSLALSVLKLLQELMLQKHDTLEGKNIGIFGRSYDVGRPLLELLIQQDANVMLLKSDTPIPENRFAGLDIVISAAKKPRYWTTDKIDPTGKILIDTGINFVDDVLVGDFDYDNLMAANSAEYISQMPCGIEKICTACLFAKLFANKRAYVSDIDDVVDGVDQGYDITLA